MTTVVLLGELGRRFGRRHELDIRSPAEAVRALCANFAEFLPFVASSSERHVGYRVLAGRDPVAAADLHLPAPRVTIAPVIMGAGGSIGQILTGVALVGAAFFTGGASLVSTGMFGFGTAIETTFFGALALNIGTALALGGIVQLLSPQPTASAPRERPDSLPSYAFNGAVNTTAQGQPVPIGYGELIVGSAVVSAGISTDNLSASTPSSSGKLGNPIITLSRGVVQAFRKA
jgi:predicted phage tail protein